MRTRHVIPGSIAAASVFTAMVFTACPSGESSEVFSPVCESSNPLAGTWKYRYSDTFTYTFSEDGTGVYDKMGTPVPFVYQFASGKLTIRFLDTKGSVVTHECFLSGSSMNIKDQLGGDSIYTRA